MRRLSTSLLVVGVCAALGACSTVLSIDVSGPLHRPVFKAEDRSGRVCISDLTISRRDNGEEVWRLQKAGRGCAEFTQLTYGELPSGMTESATAKALEEGVVYVAWGHGDIPGPLGAIWVGGGGYIFADGAWRQTQH